MDPADQSGVRLSNEGGVWTEPNFILVGTSNVRLNIPTRGYSAHDTRENYRSYSEDRDRSMGPILLVTISGVCQSQSSQTAGPYTAFQQQYTLMRDAGYVAPDPRQQLLTDL